MPVKTLPVYVNVAFFAARPLGTVVAFETPEARDAALARCRERAIAGGLAASAARAGIYPADRTVAHLKANRGRVGFETEEVDHILVG